MSPSNCNQLFIYSSLRKGFNKPSFNYISHFFEYIAPAKVKGILCKTGNDPVAIPNETHFIKGELYRLKNENDFSWVFGQLDEYEGLDVEPGEKPLFRRELTAAYPDNLTETNAWIYWYNAEINDMPVISSGDILQPLERI